MKAIYPGTFDPVTNGHLDIIQRARKIFDQLVVAVGNNAEKRCTFCTESRIAMLKDTLAEYDDIEVISFENLMVKAARDRGIKVVIRGLRAISDYEKEVQMAIMNRSLENGIDTVFLVASHEWSFISSSLLKDIFRFGGDISPFVPDSVLERFRKEWPE